MSKAIADFYVIRSPEIRANCVRAINHITSNGPLMSVRIEKYVKNRSTAQNRLMWMWLNLIAKELGHDVDDLHEEMKVRVWGTQRKTIAGQPVIMPRSTTTLTTDEMTKHLEAIEALANDLNIKLPIPEYNFAMGYDQQEKSAHAHG